MKHSVRIRNLPVPPATAFDPGEFLGSLEFYETTEGLNDAARDELAQFAHSLAFIAIFMDTARFETSTVLRDTSAFRVLESYFGDLEGWRETAQNERGIPYRILAGFLMQHYPPRPPNSQDELGWPFRQLAIFLTQQHKPETPKPWWKFW